MGAVLRRGCSSVLCVLCAGGARFVAMSTRPEPVCHPLCGILALLPAIYERCSLNRIAAKAQCRAPSTFQLPCAPSVCLRSPPRLKMVRRHSNHVSHPVKNCLHRQGAEAPGATYPAAQHRWQRSGQLLNTKSAPWLWAPALHWAARSLVIRDRARGHADAPLRSVRPPIVKAKAALPLLAALQWAAGGAEGWRTPASA